MGQALYRSYRSKTFSDVVGQDHITKTLQSAIKSGRISHAYLFTGPRGVGKTSVARILAREVNGLSYEGENINLDIIEIDAASNRRIDEIRDLRDKVNIAPTSSKYKVYIIDEVHMLTKEAFNALLKTLEEPPAHVIFILATTEAHKLPETIISRTQRFSFKPIENAAATAHLDSVAKAEKINIDKAALQLIAEYGEGSFRDSLSLLDQLSSVSKKITCDTVTEHLGLPEKESIERLLQKVATADASGVLAILEMLSEQAIDPATLAKSLAKSLRLKILGKDYQGGQIQLLKSLIEVPASPNPSERLEVSLIEATITSGTGLPGPKPTVAPPQEVKLTLVTPSKKIVAASLIEGRVNAKKPKSIENFDLSLWEDVLTEIKAKAASLYTALRLAAPEFSGTELKLYFEFPLHQKKVNQAHHKDVICSVIETISGNKIQVTCYLDKDKARAHKNVVAETPISQPEDKSELQAISNIFGGLEVLES